MSLRGLTRWLEHASAVIEQATREGWSPAELDARMTAIGHKTMDAT